VQDLLAELCPLSPITDLGGVMSLNVHLHDLGSVLRIHQPFVSRSRLLALQRVREQLIQQGMHLPKPLHWLGQSVFHFRNRWAELDDYIAHQKLPHTTPSYVWLFQQMGIVHGALQKIDFDVPRPLVAAYAPPRSLRRWLMVTAASVEGDADAVEAMRLLKWLVRQAEKVWIPANTLPAQLVHGDVRLSNVCQTSAGGVVYFDLGFLALRPRIHELAYALVLMLISQGAHFALDAFDWSILSALVDAYEGCAPSCLSPAERRALVSYMATVPLYAAALDGFTEAPAAKLRSRLPALEMSRWLLANANWLTTGLMNKSPA
jgi:Ser/Thr protein kinase RdoA (MazF antagonist)